MPMPPWTAILKVSPFQIRIMLQNLDGEVVLRACLPMPPEHPRALLDLLEAFSLWHGHPLDTVLSAAARSASSFDAALWGDDLLWGPSARVHITFLACTGRQLRLAPVADHRPSWSRR